MAGTAPAVNVWLTTGDKSSLFEQQQDVIFQPGTGSGGFTMNVTPSTTYQTIEGFGAHLTDSSAWLIENELNASQRDHLMKLLFSPSTGTGFSFLRLPMGASDFSASGFYTYNDLPSGQTDVTQSQFSIAHDQQYIIPQLQQALALNPDLRLMGTPWSAPAWMKTSGSLVGGQLQSQYYGSYATYLKKFIEAYAAEGLTIDAMSLQNEPLFTPVNYPGMSMTSAQQTDLIKNHVGPVFDAAGIDTEIFVYDHNWDDTDYPIDVLDDPEANPYVAGTSFHGYAGSVSAQSTVHNAHPDKSVYFTEISGGDFAPNFSDNLVWGVENIIIGNMRNWGETALYWNLALNQNDGPHIGGCNDCRGVVTINSTTGNVTLNEEYYALAHASKFVQPGAVRIDSRTIDNIVETVAFSNPDGSTVVIALNPSSSTRSFRIVEGGEHFSYQLPGKAVATFTWPSREADFDNGGFEELGGTLNGWTVFGNSDDNVSSADEEVLDGDYSLKLFGQFNGSANWSGVSQGISVSAGDVVRAMASTFVDSLDSIVGTANEVAMKIEFYDEFGGAFGTPDLISESQITIADGSSTEDAWLDHMLTETAPAGAEEARLVFYFLQPNDEFGAVHIDRSLIQILPDGLPGDYNDDGVVNAADYVVWRNNLGQTGAPGIPGDGDNGSGTGTPDGIVNQADYNFWRGHYGTTSGAGSANSNPPVPEPNSIVTMLFCVAALLPVSRCGSASPRTKPAART